VTVYVLEIGAYSQRGVAGVYATLAAAKASMPHITDWEWSDPAWVSNSGDTACIESYEVKE
jgi:hypothetical protein